MNSIENQKIAFQLKGSLFTLTVLQLIKPDLEAFAIQLHELVKQAPKFFLHAPVVIDLQKLSAEYSKPDFVNIIAILRKHQLIPIGIRSGTPQQQQAAQEAGLAIFPESKHDQAPSVQAEKPLRSANTSMSKPQAPPLAKTKLITQPVRSGQQIYAQNADLIVLAAVSPGAELLADGNIHVYGPLRGRALAGISGDVDARIFCQSLEAELVSVAGHYWISEDLQQTYLGKAVSIHIYNDKLHIEQL